MEPKGSSDRRPIGEIFVERGHVSEEDLRAALEYQREVGGMLLGEILVERGLVSRLVLASVLGEQWDAHERRSSERRSRILPDGEVGHGDAGPAIAGSAEAVSAASELREVVAAARETSSSEVFGLAAMLDERLRAVVEELGGRLDTLLSIDARLSDMSSGERQTVTGIYEAIAQLRSELAERGSAGATQSSALHGAIEAMREAFASREPATIDLAGLRDELALLRSDVTARESAVTACGATHDAVVDLRESFVALAGRLDALAAGTPSIEELELFDGLHGWGDERIAAFAAANGGALQTELATFESRLVDPIVARLDALGGLTHELEIRIGEGLAGAAERQERATHEVRQALDSLQRTLEPSLQERTTNVSDTIEELQLTIDELHARLAQAESPADHPQAVPELSHVVFAPTQAGYELVEREGAVPPVGSELSLPAVDGQFRVVRIGRSPLPLDCRRCAYLEPLVR